MFKSLVLQVRKFNRIPVPSAVRNLCSIYDPPYLESMKPKIPIYDMINIQMKSFDFALLENYQKVVHKIANALNLDITDGWATPAKELKIQKFKPNSTIVDNEYFLSLYERNIQISDLPSNQAPILIELIQAALPQGVSFCVLPHQEEYEKVRYVPDFELTELHSQLKVLGGPVKKRK